MKLVVLTPEELEALMSRAVESALSRQGLIDEVMTTETAAKFLGMHPKILSRKAQAGEVPGSKALGSEWRFLRSELIAHLKSKEVA